MTSVPAMNTRPASSNVTGFSRASAPSGVAVAERERRAGARARSARGTSPRCRGSGSRAALRACARRCSCRPRRGRRWRRSSFGSPSPGGRRNRGSLSPRIRRPRSGRPRARRRRRSRRASRSGGRRPRRSSRRAGASGTPRTAKPSGVAPRSATPIARSASVTVSIRSLSFARSSSAPLDVGRAVRERAEQRERAAARRRGAAPPSRLILVATSGCADDLDVADQLARDAAVCVDADARAHPLEHVEDPGPARVQADVVDGERRAGQQRRRDEERRGRGDVAGDDAPRGAQRRAGLDADRARPAP